MNISAPERRAQLELPDGRLLAWSEWGEADGQPIVFCTGAGMSGSLGFGFDDLRKRGMRLLAVDRPGLGGSSPHARKTLGTWNEDIHVWLSQLELEGVGAVGFSQGAPFALALAAAGLVQAVAVVAGQDELAYPPTLAQLPPDVRRMVAEANADADAFQAHFAGFADAAGLLKLVLEMCSDHDRTVYQSEPFLTAYRDCLEEGFIQGADGYARDLLNALKPWPFALEDIHLPVSLWYGEQDSSPVHSPDFGRTLAARLPLARWHLLPQEGSSLLWTKAAEILGELHEQLALK